MAHHPSTVNFQPPEQNTPKLTHCTQSKTTSKAHTGVNISVPGLSVIPRVSRQPSPSGPWLSPVIWLYQVLNLLLLTFQWLRVTWLFLSASKHAQAFSLKMTTPETTLSSACSHCVSPSSHMRFCKESSTFTVCPTSPPIHLLASSGSLCLLVIWEGRKEGRN